MNKIKAYTSPVIESLFKEISPEELEKTEKRMLLSRMAAFRSPMQYNVVQVLSPFENDKELREALMELEKRNLIQFDRERARYDLHQVIRNNLHPEMIL